MTQPSFDFRDDSPRARRTDPLSSHRASDAITPHLSGQRRKVWEALQAHPGRSSKDLASVSGLDRYMIARRLPELLRHGRVERVERDGGDCLWFAKEGE